MKYIDVDFNDKNKLIYNLIEQGGYLCSKAEQERLEDVLKRTSNLNAVLYGIGAVTAEERSFLICQKPVSVKTDVPVVQINSNKRSHNEMDINSESIEKIVKQVMSELGGTPAAPKAAGDVPKTSRVAMLTKLEHYDIKE